MNVIKISKEVFETILDKEIAPLDKEHLPYNEKLCIAFPYTFFRSADEMIEDSLKEFKKIVNSQGLGYKQALEKYKDHLDVTKQRIVKYCESDLHVIFDINQLEITVKHSKPNIIGLKEQVLFNGFNFFGFIPSIKINEINSDGFWFYKTLLKLVAGVIYALNNPKQIEITETRDIQVSNVKKKNNRKKKHSNVRYISNVRYLNIPSDENKTSKSYNYTMEAWEVRGHWRHLKNGKQVWIEAYVKGDKEKLGQEDTVYKLNRVEID